MEAAFLAALEKRDAEYYNLSKARQDLQLTRGTVRLQALRVREAEGGVRLAELQRERAELQETHYNDLLSEGTIAEEEQALLAMTIAVPRPQAAPLRLSLVVELPLSLQHRRPQAPPQRSPPCNKHWQATSDGGKSGDTFETFRPHDIRIGSQQERLAQEHVRVVEQEQRISELQADFAEATVEYLANERFTNVELYDWMSTVLQGTYSTLLQQASATAALAESQLAFERQQAPAAIIQADYWETPPDQISAVVGDGGPDRRGLTGSARLLADIYRLDQYRFETERREQRLTKTISLAQLDPFSFQRLRETGVMRLEIPLSLFQRELPDHYMLRSGRCAFP